MGRTLVICKPDAVARGLVGELIARLEHKGLHLAAARMLLVDAELAGRLYEEHVDKPFYDHLIAFITSAPALAMVVEGPADVWRVVRNLLGPTDPAEAPPGSIRGDLATTTPDNVIHGSDGPESAVREIALFFPDLA
jgi:nucleoside-diphosphate kinase